MSILTKWKGINPKQSTRWQHLSQLKASVFFSLQNFVSSNKTQQLILGTWDRHLVADRASLDFYDPNLSFNACLQHYCKLEIYGSLGKFFFLHRYLI